MKKVLSLITLNFSLLIFSQNLSLANKVRSCFELPQKLDQNDIALIYEINGGSTAFDSISYFYIDGNQDVKWYYERRPKLYLTNHKLIKTVEQKEVTIAKKQQIINIIDSKQLVELLKYNQQNFKINIKENIPPPCGILDQFGFKITVIQNNKMSTYSYYAPKYYYESCPHKTISKPMLKRFIDVLDLFEKSETSVSNDLPGNVNDNN